MKLKPVHKTYVLKQDGKRSKRVIERLYIGSTMLWRNWSNTTIAAKMLESVKTIDEFNLYQKDLTEFLGVGRFALVKGEFSRKYLKGVASSQVLHKLCFYDFFLPQLLQKCFLPKQQD